MAVVVLERGLALIRGGDRGLLVLLLLFALMLPLSTPRVYATDEVQYYVYLRSLRFDGDLDFANDYARFAAMNPASGVAESLLQPNRIRPATGLYGNIAPVGSAIMWAPFFLLADLLVHLANALGANVPADGFSRPYLVAVCYASALYGLLGLLLSYRLARPYATPFATTLASVTIWLATPLVFYMFIQMPFAHATGFFLVALFLTIWQRTRNEPGGRSLRAWLALGLVGGLMTITREQLGLFLLVPAVEALVAYWRFLRGPAGRSRRALARAAGLFAYHALFLVAFLFALVPQLLVYQVLNGSPRPASEVSGKLNLCSPHLIDTLIDYNPAPSSWCNVVGDKTADFPPFAHGALIWSPVLVPALLGLLLLWRRDRLLCVVLALAFVAQVYINGAFGSTWHLTGSFGFRRLIECTPIFILGLALLVDRLGRRTWLVVPAAALIAWNAGLIVNWTVFNELTGLREGMTWPDLWRWQLEAPGRVVTVFNDLIFDRCRFMENNSC